MIAFPAGARVWIAGGTTDMRCGMDSLARSVQQGLGRDPHGGEIFCFCGRKGDLIKVLWHDGVGMSLGLKRLEGLRSSGRSARAGLACRCRRPGLAISWKVRRGQRTVRGTVRPDARLAQSALDPGGLPRRVRCPFSLCFIGIFCRTVIDARHVGERPGDRCFARRPWLAAEARAFAAGQELTQTRAHGPGL